MDGNKSEKLHFDVKATGKNPTKTLVETPRSQIIIKDHKSPDGVEESISSEEYLLSSLAGCISRIAFISAYERNINLREIEMKLEGDIDISKFKGEKENSRSGFKNIQVTLETDTDAEKSLINKMVEDIRNRSQIIDSLENKVAVKIQNK